MTAAKASTAVESAASAMETASSTMEAASRETSTVKATVTR
jgi:hypothetical protein